MALTQTEILTALASFAELGEEAQDLIFEIKASREDGEIDAEEKRLRRRAVKKLARSAAPIVIQLALDALD